MNAQAVQARRAKLERAIENAIALLDLLDVDADLEDTGDDEPWLAACENHHDSQVGWLRGGDRDLEDASACW